MIRVAYGVVSPSESHGPNAYYRGVCRQANGFCRFTPLAGRNFNRLSYEFVATSAAACLELYPKVELEISLSALRDGRREAISVFAPWVPVPR